MPTEGDLVARWEATLPNQAEIGRDLIRRYGEPHRRYHTQTHLGEVLDWVEEFAEPGHDLFLVRLAAWFHDAVYAIPPGQVSNEEASARLAHRALGRVGLEQEDLNEVARLVRLTATHLPGPRDPSGELLCDADLAILAAEPDAYAGYVDAVTAEYAFLPRHDFVVGRLDVLGRLLERPLFRTGRGRALEERARANLEAECAALAAEAEALVEGSNP